MVPLPQYDAGAARGLQPNIPGTFASARYFGDERQRDAR